MTRPPGCWPKRHRVACRCPKNTVWYEGAIGRTRVPGFESQFHPFLSYKAKAKSRSSRHLFPARELTVAASQQRGVGRTRLGGAPAKGQ
jgi:hypothetical protein